MSRRERAQEFIDLWCGVNNRPRVQNYCWYTPEPPKWEYVTIAVGNKQRAIELINRQNELIDLLRRFASEADYMEARLDALA